MGARRYGSFSNDDSTHFSVLRVSAYALDNCYSRIDDSFIFIHSNMPIIFFITSAVKDLKNFTK